MKAIYLNIDPYLQAFADWLNAGKPGTAPCFDPLPVAVTIPLGESAAIYCPSAGEAETDPGDAANEVSVSGQTLSFYQTADDGIPVDAIAVKVAPGLSAIAPSAKYWVEAVTGDTSAKVAILDSDGNAYYVTFTVLVRREQPQGPVDLVDFTPPASGGTPSAADIRSALVAAGSGALAGVCIDGTTFTFEAEKDPFPIESNEPGTATYIMSLASASD